MKLSRDVNGNKILKVESKDFGLGRGFSVQTNGNLPKTHKMDKCNLNINVALCELHCYIKEYGTDKQKEKLGW